MGRSRSRSRGRDRSPPRRRERSRERSRDRDRDRERDRERSRSPRRRRDRSRSRSPPRRSRSPPRRPRSPPPPKLDEFGRPQRPPEEGGSRSPSPERSRSPKRSRSPSNHYQPPNPRFLLQQLLAYDGAKVTVLPDEGDRGDRKPKNSRPAQIDGGVARSLSPGDLENGMWEVSPANGPSVMVPQGRLRVVLPPPPSRGALRQLTDIVSLWDRVSVAEEELVLSVLGQAAELGTVHDFRRVLECVPGKHISPGLYMKSVAIASMWTRGEAADGEVRYLVITPCCRRRYRNQPCS